MGCDVLLILRNWGYCYSLLLRLWWRLWDFCYHFFGQGVDMSFVPAHLTIRHLWKVNFVTSSQGSHELHEVNHSSLSSSAWVQSPSCSDAVMQVPPVSACRDVQIPSYAGFCDIRSCMVLCPCSKDVEWYTNRAKWGSEHLSISLFVFWTARSASLHPWVNS